MRSRFSESISETGANDMKTAYCSCPYQFTGMKSFSTGQEKSKFKEILLLPRPYFVGVKQQYPNITSTILKANATVPYWRHLVFLNFSKMLLLYLLDHSCTVFKALSFSTSMLLNGQSKANLRREKPFSLLCFVLLTTLPCASWSKPSWNVEPLVLQDAVYQTLQPLFFCCSSNSQYKFMKGCGTLSFSLLQTVSICLEGKT